MSWNFKYNWVFCAISRWGKDELLRYVMAKYWFPFRFGCLWIDPQGTGIRKVLLDLKYSGRLKDVIWIALRDTDVNVGIDFIVPSDAEDIEERRQQNENRRENHKKKLLAPRGLLDSTKNPLYEEGLNTALDVMFWCDTNDFHDYWVMDIFIPHSDAQRFFLAHCTNERAAERLRRTWDMSPQQRRDHFGPAERILNDFYGKSVVQRHSGATFDWDQAVDDGKFIFVDGAGMEGPDQYVMYTSLAQKYMDKFRRGSKRPGKIIANECNRWLDDSMAISHREDMKFGLTYCDLLQNPLDMANEVIRNEVFNNSFLAAGRQNNHDAAKFLGARIGTTNLDSMKVHHVDTRYRQIHTGYQYEEGKSVTIGDDKHSTTTRQERIPVYGEAAEQVNVYQDYTAQEKEAVQDLLRCRKGEFHFCAETVTPKPAYVPMLPDKFPGFEGYRTKMIDEIIAEIKTRPEYRRFVREEPPCLPMMPTPKSKQKRKIKGMR